MKIVVIGGTGLIGSKTVAILRQGGHEVVAASPKSGINSITGEGLKTALAGAQVVIDLANSPSFEDKAVLEFFETSGRNLLPAEAAAGVRHHVALSIVGTDRSPDIGYFRAKVAQEKLMRLRRALYHRPLDPVPGVPRRHRRFHGRGKFGQGLARPVPAHRGGRRRRHRRRSGAGRAAKRHRRDRRPGASAVQRNRRPLPEGGRRPAEGREGPRGAILRWPGRREFARSLGPGAPRPHRPRRLGSPRAAAG